MSKMKSLEEIIAGWDQYERPQDGAQFKHYKGGTYTIVATGFLEDSETPCVIYHSDEKHIVWVRTAENFFEEVEVDTGSVVRFVKL